MGKTRFARWLRPAALLALATLTCGCNHKDAEAMTRIGKKLAGLAGDMRENLDSGWQEVYQGMSLEARVAARLHWYKSLADSAIQVKTNAHEVELTGSVRTPEQKRRAFDLAESTAGVDKVNDTLEIRSP